MNDRAVRRALTAATLVAACAAGTALGDVLYSNGPFITNPTGGTGAIAGLPISNADPFTMPGSSLIWSTTGTGATVAGGTAVAENFVVPEGETWDLNAVTLYAFQTSQTTATVHSIHINLWTAAPYSPDSPGELPDVIPQPVLSEPLVLDAGEGTFVAHRQSPTGTTSNRPVFAYTVSLDGLPNGGILPPGEYWLQWSFDGVLAPSQNVFMPLVSPRTEVEGHNARLLNSVTGSATGPRVWFEGREGWVPDVQEGRAYELPFELHGTSTSVGGGCAADWDGDEVVNSGDISAFLTSWIASVQAGDTAGDFDGDGTTNSGDISSFLTAWIDAVTNGC